MNMNSNFKFPISGPNPGSPRSIKIVDPGSGALPITVGGGYQESGRDGDVARREGGKESGPQPQVIGSSGGPVVQKSESSVITNSGGGGVSVNGGTKDPGSTGNIGGRKNYAVASQSPDRRAVTSVGGSSGSGGGSKGSSKVVEVQASSGGPRLATKVVETVPLSEFANDDVIVCI